MKRRTRARARALLGVAGALMACETEIAPTPSGGSAGLSTVGASAGQAGTATGGAPSSAGQTAGGGATTTGGNVSAGAAGNGGAAGNAANAGNAGSAGSAGAGGSNSPPLPQRVLLYHFSTLSIPSLPAQLALLTAQLKSWSYEVEDSVDASDLSSENLARFAAVGMINTCFEPFGVGKMGEAQTAALKSFVESGGGLFGTHCASVTFQSVEPPHPYNGLIGGRGGHGSFDGKSACRVDHLHATTSELPPTFDYTGNLDNADYLAADAQVLVTCKWSAGEMKDTAVSWYRTPGAGRVFYTNFAKVETDLQDPVFGEKHILRGLGWVLGR